MFFGEDDIALPVFSLKYSKGKFSLHFGSEKWRNTAEIQGKSNDSLLFT